MKKKREEKVLDSEDKIEEIEDIDIINQETINIEDKDLDNLSDEEIGDLLWRK